MNKRFVPFRLDMPARLLASGVRGLTVLGVLFIATSTMGSNCECVFQDCSIPDAGGDGDGDGDGDDIVAEDIGTLCTYADGSGENPTNGCKAGLECLIVTLDGNYENTIVDGQGAFVRGWTNAVWEDQTTKYLPPPASGPAIDQGICTKISTWDDRSFTCPVGTVEKFFSTNMKVCLRSCNDATDCPREGDVCDTRYFDTAGGTCVRACEVDVPDCLRSGIGSSSTDQTLVQAYAYAPDLQGASMCNVTTGQCADALHTVATSGPGLPCDTTDDCAFGLTCFQSHFFSNFPNNPGVCALPCAPYSQALHGPPSQQVNPAVINKNACAGAGAEYVCQAAFKYNFDPFLLKDENLNDNAAGGFCMVDCTGNAGACATQPGTTCGSLNTEFREPWNGFSMCLLPHLSN